MMIRQNTAQSLMFSLSSATMDKYALDKNGGGFVLGAGTFTNFPLGGHQFVQINLTAGDTDTLGRLTVLPLDVSNTILGLDNQQILTALPGDTVFLDTVERNALALTLMTLTDGVETGFTLRDVMKVVASVLGGKAATVGNVWTVRNIGDTLDRVIVDVAPPADRTAVTLDLS